MKEITIYSFDVYFPANEANFTAEQYGQHFQRALEEASLFGNAVVAIRGHADPGLFIQRFLDGATRRGLLKRSGFGENYTSKDGKPFDLNNIKNVLDMIDQNPGLRYESAQGGGLLRDAETSLEDLSQKRAETVRQSIVDYATKQGLVLDKSQIRFQGVGVKDPVFANPQSDMQNAKNRRVEFSIIKVPADKVQTDEFGL